VIDVERTDFVSVPVADLQRSKAFYGETLGLRPNPASHESYPEFETGNLTISLREDPGAARGGISIALRVQDVDDARGRLEAGGVAFDTETFDTGVCHVAFFRDPDGNALALHRRYAPHGDGSPS